MDRLLTDNLSKLQVLPLIGNDNFAVFICQAHYDYQV